MATLLTNIMPDFSLVCCVSKPDVFQKCLVDSLYATNEDLDIEIIPIYNYGNNYSASIALNLGIDVAKSNKVILAHQDVSFTKEFFNNLSNIDKCDDWAIIGTAGIDLKYGKNDIGRWGGALNVDTVAVGTIYDTDEAYIDGKPFWCGSCDIAEVHSVDECLFVLNKESSIRFDDSFNGFHFYGADICLEARNNGYKVYVFDLPIIHYGQFSSSLQSENGYWKYLNMLHDKWNLIFPEMYGTHMHWNDGEVISYISSNLYSNDTNITIVYSGHES